MDFLSQPDFARAMNLIVSFEDSLTDGPVNAFARMTFESMAEEFLSRLNYDKGYARYDYSKDIIKMKVWRKTGDEEPEDVMVVYINAKTLNTEISYVDKDERTSKRKSIMQKIRDLLRVDISIDPVTMDLKFRMSEKIPETLEPDVRLDFDVNQRLMAPGLKVHEYGKREDA